MAGYPNYVTLPAVKSSLLIPIAIVFATSCGQISKEEKTSISKNAAVIGVNKRTLVNPNEFATSELRMIGLLKRPNNRHCTATLIAKDLIITAGHCLTNDHDPGYQKGTYTFKVKTGTEVLESETTEEYYWDNVATARDRDLGKDWAIIRLKEDLGTKAGWFGIRWKLSIPQWESLGRLKLVGFSLTFSDPSIGKNQMTYTTCNVQKAYLGIITHDCDTESGDSGAPLYKCDAPLKCFIYAIHHGYRDNFESEPKSKYINAATNFDSEKLQATIKSLLSF